MSSINLSITHADLAIKTINKLIGNGVFSMAYAGSNGETKKVIKKFLIGDDEISDEELHKHFNEFLNNLSDNEKSLLQSVNKIYVKNGFSLLDSYIHTINQYYQGQFEQIDFTSPNACDVINDFVKKSTNDIIEKLISSDDLDDLTRLVLINAIYFKGKWCVKFNKNATHINDFYTTDSVTKKVDMMFAKDKYEYYEDDEYQIIQLEYEGYQQRMVILLPKEKCSLVKKLPSLSGQRLFDLLDSVDKLPVQLYLPKFKVESTHQLKETFLDLGLQLPFTDSADFSLMTTEEPLKISKIIQKAFVEVDEEGTEAAAATAMIMMCRSSVMHKPTPDYVFRADHPFIYFILDNQRNILFSGLYH